MNKMIRYLICLLINLIIARIAIVNFGIEAVHYFIIGAAILITKFVCLEI